MAHTTMNPTQRLLTFARSAAVGIVATLVDWTVLETLVRGARVPPSAAKLTAILCGLCVQFVGSRTFTFRGANTGSLRSQVRRFAVVEAASLVLHWGLFQLLMTRAGASLELANLVTPSVVYFLFSYPMWKWVFRPSHSADDCVPAAAA